MIWLELSTTYSSSCQHHFHHPLLQWTPANPGLPGEWPLKWRESIKYKNKIRQNNTITHMHTHISIIPNYASSSVYLTVRLTPWCHKVIQAVLVASSLRPLQVDNIFAFIHQVAPVPECWLFKTSATSWPLTFWPLKWCPSHVWCGYLCANFSLTRPLCS